MRAAVAQCGELRVRDVAAPERRGGHILARPVACGVCGSDLGVLRHGEELAALRREVAARAPHGPLRAASVEPGAPTVLGHEFCAEVVDPGPARPDLRAGDLVVSMPRIHDAAGEPHTLGFSKAFPGGFGELMLLDPALALRVPGGLPPRWAALTEPAAVAHHAVGRSRLVVGEAAVVVGCGPVGLAIVDRLRLWGADPIIAADPVPERRVRARAMGADVVVDPKMASPVAVWAQEAGGAAPVVFEAVGKPGILDQVLLDAAPDTEIVVVGACMRADTVRPMLGLGREVTLRFALGYTEEEFADTLDDLVRGRLRPAVLVEEVVSLEALPSVFARMLRTPGAGKVLVADADESSGGWERFPRT